MKKIFFIILLMAAFLGMEAQEPLNYTQKLDSVVGSDDFDWSRWKKVFTYYVEDAVIQDDTYSWENGVWTLSGGNVYQYSSDFKQILGAMALDLDDTELKRASLTEYTYDDLNHLTLVMNYAAGDTSWVENSKYVYHYNEEGLLDTLMYSTIRNGNWRESERRLYAYNESQQCVELRVQGKGGWGPSANQWRDSYRYEFEYEDGVLVSELYYVPVGWFGSEMALDSKISYEFDAQGNLLKKTASVTNDSKDWIVRDVYENHYDLTVEASTIMGLEPFWKVMCGTGMDFASGAVMPLYNQWTSCSIVSASLDTEFTLYCSGFESVAEEQVTPMKAYADHGRLVVMNDQPADVVVYDLLGRVVASRKQVQQCEFGLNTGLYIVNSGNARVKVMVK